MTTAHAIHTPARHTGSGVLGWLQSLRDGWIRRRLYRRTLSQLSALSDRELADIGLKRWQLENVVYHATYEAR